MKHFSWKNSTRILLTYLGQFLTTCWVLVGRCRPTWKWRLFLLHYYHRIYYILCEGVKQQAMMKVCQSHKGILPTCIKNICIRGACTTTLMHFLPVAAGLHTFVVLILDILISSKCLQKCTRNLLLKQYLLRIALRKRQTNWP